MRQNLNVNNNKDKSDTRKIKVDVIPHVIQSFSSLDSEGCVGSFDGVDSQ